jgi:RNA polymerase subunit RPABC4/transcription elongation factor Spt4
LPIHSVTTTLDCHRITWKVEGDSISIQFWGYDGKYEFETIINQVVLFKGMDQKFSFPMCHFKPRAAEWKNYFVIMQTEEKNAAADSIEGTQAKSTQCQASKGQ